MAIEAIFINNLSALPTTLCIAELTGSDGLAGLEGYDRNFLPLRLSRYSKYDDDVPSSSSEFLLMRFSFGFFPLATFCFAGMEDAPCIARLRAANFRDPRIIVMGAGRLAIETIPVFKPQLSDAPATRSNRILATENLDVIALIAGLANLRCRSGVRILDERFQGVGILQCFLDMVCAGYSATDGNNSVVSLFGNLERIDGLWSVSGLKQLKSCLTPHLVSRVSPPRPTVHQSDG